MKLLEAGRLTLLPFCAEDAESGLSRDMQQAPSGSIPIQSTEICPLSIWGRSWVCAGKDCSVRLCPLSMIPMEPLFARTLCNGPS